MFAIGHFALGYILGKASTKITHTKLNLALLFTASIIPDVDLLLIQFINHRGPTHSLFFSVIAFLPFFVIYKKKTIPYFVAFLSHLLIGDIYSNGIQLFWPFSTNWIFISNLLGSNLISVGLELSLFVVSTIIMVINKDFKQMLFNKTSWVYWQIPFGAVLGSLLVGGISIYYNLPSLLVIPSLFYLTAFSYSIIRSTY
jgi:membrane-bound metal-dependent hydrolase YbcI (DUF457 family)